MRLTKLCIYIIERMIFLCWECILCIRILFFWSIINKDNLQNIWLFLAASFLTIICAMAILSLAKLCNEIIPDLFLKNVLFDCIIQIYFSLQTSASLWIIPRPKSCNLITTDIIYILFNSFYWNLELQLFSLHSVVLTIKPLPIIRKIIILLLQLL